MVFPLLAAAAIGAVGSLASGAMAANAAQKASDEQAKSADKALEFQKQAFETTRQDNLPWLNVGKQAIFQYGKELGLNLDPADFGEDFTPSGSAGFRATPGYQFQVEEGEKGVLNNLAALGMKNSGSALKALTRFRQGLADQTYDNYLARLSGVSGMGQGQVNNQNALTMNNALQSGNLVMESGKQRASGFTGAANAWGNALSGVSNNVSNALGMYSQMNKPINLLGGQ